MKTNYLIGLSVALGLTWACEPASNSPMISIIQSSAEGDRLKEVTIPEEGEADYTIIARPETRFQEIEGFGGAITESSAHLLQQLPEAKRREVLEAYFGDSASAYNLVRLHMNSCDFSLSSYDYIDSGDVSLESFDIAHDRDDIIPVAQEALAIAGPDLRFFASPWTASPWMKDNKAWFGGKLLPEYYDVWAQYFKKYAEAYQAEGLPIWGFTVENEPLGNDSNWESMHFSPEEMTTFIKDHLAPVFAENQMEQKILIYDQNRGEELVEWAEAILGDPEARELVHGTAVHWYTSTFKWYPESLQKTHELAPEKAIWNTEACIDAEVPHWQEDDWYWKKEATDWGFTWAKEENKPDHPKYVPVYRYARDIIGCLNNQVSAWVDWNIVLDRQGGPNHASNWCIAPVIADPEAGEVYYTPLYDALRHFSQYIKRGAHVIGQEASLPDGLHLCLVENPDGEIVIPILNTTEESLRLEFQIGPDQSVQTLIPAASLQTLLIPAKD